MAFGIKRYLQQSDVPENLAFLSAFFERAKIQIQLDEESLSHIPKEGAFIAISNHMYGSIDSLLLIYLLSSVRPDIQIFTRKVLKDYNKVNDYFMPVKSGFKRKELLSYQPLIEDFLAQGHPIGILPGRKGLLTPLTGELMIDKRWEPKMIELIYQLKQVVLPVYFQSEVPLKLIDFHHFSFDRLAAFYQQFSGIDKIVNVRIGKPISLSDQQIFVDTERYGRFLRAKCYALGSSMEVKALFPKLVHDVKSIIPSKTEAPIIEPIEQDLIVEEIEQLRKESFLFKQDNFEMYLASAYQIPNALKEIGRLRELTFRAIGEGTGNAFDLDEFDVYYQQLILWDNEKQKIAGGYRLGFGDRIFRLYGKRGFYIQTLFRIKRGFIPILQQSIELGRSYITQEYQRARLPLFLLWKGILSVLIKHPRYQYLIGPVSISNAFTKVSRQVIVAFIKEHFWDESLAVHIRPKKPFEDSNPDIDIDSLLENFKGNIKNLDKFIEEIEPEHFKTPVLVKKYIQQEAKIIGFNLDPKFSNALDGFILLKVKDIPAETIQNLQRDL